MSDVVPLRPVERTSDRVARPVRQASDRVPLWREAVGREMRRERQERDERIADVAERAGISPQYLSELERGRKDPSSEVMEAIAGALGLRTADLTRRATGRLDRVTRLAPVAPAKPSYLPGGSAPTCLAA